MQTLQEIEKEESQNINFVYSCIENKLNLAKNNINGLLSQIEKSEDLVKKVYSNTHINVDLKHLSFPYSDIKKFLEFNYDKTNRFLLILTSNLYTGELKLPNDEEFINQLQEKINDLNISIDKTDVIITPAYEGKGTFLFKINHPTMKNIYFAFVKFSPKGYKLYYFYDVFSEIFQWHFDSLKNRIFALEKEYEKLKEYFNKNNIQNAIVLKAFQKKILNEKEKLENIKLKYNEIFAVMDALKAELIKNNYSMEIIEKNYQILSDSLKEIDIRNELSDLFLKLKNKDSFEKELYLNFDKEKNIIQNNINLLNKQINDIKNRLDNELRQEKKKIEDKAIAIEYILNEKDFSYKKLAVFQSEIPSISKIGVIEERINDLEKIINENQKNFFGKIKNKIASHTKELELEKEKLNKEIKNIEQELVELKNRYYLNIKNLETNYQEKFNSQKSHIENQLRNEKEKLNNLKNSFNNSLENTKYEIKEIRKNFVLKLNEIYKKVDNQLKQLIDNKNQIIESMLSEYNEFFHTLKKYNLNFIKIFSEIEIVYSTFECNENILPNAIKVFVNELKAEEKNIKNLLNLKENYNQNLENKLNDILKEIAEINSQNSIGHAVIESIEDKFINELKLIY